MYGVPAFTAFSPDERHNVLMIRFARIRQHDTFFNSDRFTRFKPYYARDVPDMKADPDGMI